MTSRLLHALTYRARTFASVTKYKVQSYGNTYAKVEMLLLLLCTIVIAVNVQLFITVMSRQLVLKYSITTSKTMPCTHA